MVYKIDFEKGVLTRLLSPAEQKKYSNLTRLDPADDQTPVSEITVNFNGLVEGISFLLPDKLPKNFFTQLESLYMQQRLPDDSFVSIPTYCKLNGVSKQSVYDRIRYKKVLTLKKGRYVFVKDIVK